MLAEPGGTRKKRKRNPRNRPGAVEKNQRRTVPQANGGLAVRRKQLGRNSAEDPQKKKKGMGCRVGIFTKKRGDAMGGGGIEKAV